MLAGTKQSFVEGLDVRVEANSDHGAEEECCSSVNTAAADAALTSEFAAVSIKGRDSGQCGDLTAIQ